MYRAAEGQPQDAAKFPDRRIPSVPAARLDRSRRLGYTMRMARMASEPAASGDGGDPRRAGRLERRVAAAALVLAVVLLGVKTLAWWLTRSAAIWSDAAESLVNVLAGGLALWSLHWAARPADETHHYGHGRLEPLVAAVEGGMVSLAALAIVFRGIEGLVAPELERSRLGLGVGLTLGTAAANVAMGLALRSIGRRHRSIVLEAGGLHLLVDALSTLVAAAALGLVSWTGLGWWDPLGAIALGLAAGVAGFRLVRHAVGGLLDEADVADTRRIEAIIAAGEGHCSFHKVRHRRVGREHWVDFHLQVPPDLDVARSHALAKRIEDAIEEALPGTATAHVEPCEDPKCLHRRNRA